MESRRRILYLTVIMVAAVVAVAAINLVSLYRTGLAEGRERLRETAQSQARLIEAVARFDLVHSADVPGGSSERTAPGTRRRKKRVRRP